MGDSVTYSGITDWRNFKLSRLSILLISLGTTIYFLYGQLLLPLWTLSLLPIGVVLGIYSIKRATVALFILLLTATLIELKPEHGTFTTYVALAGIVISALLFSGLLKRLFSLGNYSVNSREYALFVLYFIWTFVIGINNLFGIITFDNWYREILVICPLLIIPPLFLFIDLNKKSERYFFYGTMLLIWLICFLSSIIHVRSSFLASTYLYEVSYAPINIVAAPFMAFVFFHLFLLEKKGTVAIYYVAGLIISFIAIFLTHNRTMWVLAPLGLFLAFFFIPTEERKRGYKLFAFLSLSLLVVLGTIYISLPFERILIQAYVKYFLTTGNLGSDASLMGRYIEWRYVFLAIKQSPVIGYGIGNIYHSYNWFGGWFQDQGYTHNGYLGALLKGGIVGFIMLFSAYCGFIWKGIKLLRNKLLSSVERAFIRAGITALLLLLIAMNTLNIFAHRDILLYVGVVWGYFIYIGYNAPNISRISATHEVLTDQKTS
jgi:O-antigen ligase